MQQAEIHRSVRGLLTAAGLIMLLSLATVSATAQDSGQSSVPAPSPTPQPTPIAASDIPARAAGAADTARQAVANSVPDARLQEIQKSLPDEQARIKDLDKKTSRQVEKPGPASMIKETEKDWLRVRDRLGRWLADLATRSGALDTTLDDLKSRADLWRLTRDHQSGTALPKSITQQITDTIKSLGDAENQVQSARNSILDLQANVARELSGVNEMLAKQQQEISERTKGVLGIDSPPLWKSFGSDRDGGEAREGFVAHWQEQWRSLKSYVAEQGGSLLVWVLIWPALAGLLFVMHRKAEVWATQDKSLQTAAALLSRPVSAALVLTAILNGVFQPQAPSAWSAAVGIVLAVALLRVLPGLMPTSMGPAPYLLVLLYIFFRAVKLAPEGFFVYRLALLVLAASGITVSVWLIRVLRADNAPPSKPGLRAVLYGARAALVLFGVGAAADIIGSVDFSTLTLTGTTLAMLNAALIWVVSLVLRSMVRIALLTDTARRIGLAPAHSDTVRTTTFRMISFFAVVGWGIVALENFLLLDPLLAGIRRMLDWKISIGALSIDPGDLLIFGFIIWLSMRIATFVQFILNVDLLPRMDLPRGVPQTISRLTRYMVIAVGAVIASAAAGFDISKVTIVIGALGVGVGFGLQNIVNNFVSGLILLFERPIRVGDTLDIEATGGVVEKIGMRASVVSTWDGAEIIVPNAQLISEAVTNWTLNHDRRRMVIPVGVAYGTDPLEAAELIVGVAKDNKDVDAHPDPACLFVGFGDSSLDFQLRAWTAGSKFTSVASDLRFAIATKLDEAGIEIPFPQRDLHLRTADPGAAASAGVRELVDVPAEDGAVGSDVKTEEDTKSTGS